MGGWAGQVEWKEVEMRSDNNQLCLVHPQTFIRTKQNHPFWRYRGFRRMVFVLRDVVFFFVGELVVFFPNIYLLYFFYVKNQPSRINHLQTSFWKGVLLKPRTSFSKTSLDTLQWWYFSAFCRNIPTFIRGSMTCPNDSWEAFGKPHFISG